jgi:hypothetical protein
MLAAAVASAAACLGALAIGRSAFGLFCVAAALIGASGAFVLQYRFAAAEQVEPSRVGTAVAVVLAGGVAAGFLGPQLATWGRDLSSLGPFAGSFLLLAGAEVCALLLLSLLRERRDPEPRASGGSGGSGESGRASGGHDTPSATAQEQLGIRATLSQPAALMAILAACCASGVMTFSMTAAPLGMHVLGSHTLGQTSFAVQSHIVAMYLPSFFTGVLISHVSLFAVMTGGALLLAASAGVAMLGQQLGIYWTSLVLLGLGWNLLFIGGTTLLARTYRPGDRFAIQGLNDLLVVAVQAVASLGSSVVLFAAGWRAVNLIALPVVGAVLVALVAVRRIQGTPLAKPEP